MLDAHAVGLPIRQGLLRDQANGVLLREVAGRMRRVGNVDVELHVHLASTEADHRAADAISLVNFREHSLHQISSSNRL